MKKPLVGIILSTRADFNIMKRGLEALRVMGIPYVLEMASPHRNPGHLMEFVQNARGRGMEVLICAAGGSGAVASLIASHTTLPVVAVPVDSTPLRGEDALFSMVQTPPGVPVAVVGINGAENAALLAAQMLAIRHSKYLKALEDRRTQYAQRLDSAAAELLADYPDLADPARTAPLLDEEENDTDPGPEDVTPEPGEDDDKKEKMGDVIRPGAQLSRKSPAAPVSSNLDLLIETPVPQEPGTVTEDATLLEGEGLLQPGSNEEDPLPIPTDSDLYPEWMRAETEKDIIRPERNEEEEETAEFEEKKSGDLEKRAVKVRDTIDTKVFDLSPDNPDEDILSHAMMVILEGGVVAFPTDTVYGLAADALNAEAVRKLYQVKNHDVAHKSLSVLIGSQEELENLVREVPPAIESILEKYWPGALTILFYKHSSVLSSVTDSNSIAVRIPASPPALRLMQMIKRPLAVINASLDQDPPSVDANQVIDKFDGKVHCILNAGPCKSAQTSTVLSVISEPFEVIRQGAISSDKLRETLGDKLKV